MARSLLIELNPAAVEVLDGLMHRFGESSREAMIARALGLLDLAKDYIDERGVLTVAEPGSTVESADESLVELVFENWKGRPEGGAPAPVPRAA